MKYIKFENFINSTQYGYTAETTSPISGDAKYLRITDIVPYFVEKDRVPYCAIDASKVNKYLVHDGDVLIARTGATTGYNLVVDDSFKNYVFASYLIRFNYDRKRLHPRYLKYVLKSPSWYGFVNNYIGGSAQPGMNARVFGKYYLPYTVFSTQQKIASILSAYDSLIENNKKRIKLLEQMAENLKKEWFVRFRFPGYETAEFEGGVPKGWRIEKLKDVSSIVYGFPFNSNQFCSDASLNPVVRIRDIADKHTETYTSEKPDDKYLIHTNDVLIGMDGIFHMNIWTNDGDYLNQRVVKVTSTKPHLSNLFIFQSIFPQVKMLESIISGTTVAHLSAKDMCKMTILIPDKHTLELSFSKFESMMAMRNKLLIQNDLLTHQRDLLLPRLMSGKLNI